MPLGFSVLLKGSCWQMQHQRASSRQRRSSDVSVYRHRICEQLISLKSSSFCSQTQLDRFRLWTHTFSVSQATRRSLQSAMERFIIHSFVLQCLQTVFLGAFWVNVACKVIIHAVKTCLYCLSHSGNNRRAVLVCTYFVFASVREWSPGTNDGCFHKTRIDFSVPVWNYWFSYR